MAKARSETSAVAAAIGPTPPVDGESAWRLLLAVRDLVDRGGTLPAVSGWREVAGAWQPVLPERAELVLDGKAGGRDGRRALDPSARELLELHLDHASRPPGQGHVVALLGQSLDGFIATRDGQSRYINGAVSLVHLHRLRALSDAVLIGVGTAVADEPRLTTRHVPGPDAVRVVIDPRGRLSTDSGLLRDGQGPTLVLRAATAAPGERRLTEQATAIDLPAVGDRLEPASVLAVLQERGLSRVLIEGGGCTVARFLEAGLLDRLQLAVSPLILGGGRPALPVAPVERLERALRPACRRYLLGEDVLFDLRLRERLAEDESSVISC